MSEATACVESTSSSSSDASAPSFSSSSIPSAVKSAVVAHDGEEEGGGARSDGIMRMSSTDMADDSYYASTIRLRPPYELYLYYFCHGVQEDLPATALYLVLKDSFQLEPAAYAYISCLTWIPWILKPLFGYLSDTCPIGGKRRLPYIAIGILFNLVGWLLLSAYTMIESEVVYIAIMWFSYVAAVMSETAVDSLLAEMARLETEGNIGLIQSSVWTWDAAGSVFGAAIPIVLFYFEVDPQVLLLLNAACIAMSALAIPFIREQPLMDDIQQQLDENTAHSKSNNNYASANNSSVPASPSTVTIEKSAAGAAALVASAEDSTGCITNGQGSDNGNGSGLRECFQNPLLLKSLAFVFIVSSSPTSGDAFTYFQTDVLGFSASFLSWTTVIQSAANFVAAYAYAAFLRTWDMRLVFQNTILFTMIVGLINVIVVKRWNTAMGIPDKVFVVGDTLAQGVAGEIIFMPVAVLAAHLAPKGREGTVYAIVMSVLNLAWSFSEFLSGVLAWLFSIKDGNYDNLSYLILIVSAFTLVPLFFLRCLPELAQLRFEENVDTHSESTETEEELGSGSSDEGGEDAAASSTSRSLNGTSAASTSPFVIQMPDLQDQLGHPTATRRTKDKGLYSQVALAMDEEEGEDTEHGRSNEKQNFLATRTKPGYMHQEQENQQQDRRSRKTKRKDNGVYCEVIVLQDDDAELM